MLKSANSMLLTSIGLPKNIHGAFVPAIMLSQSLPVHYQDEKNQIAFLILLKKYQLKPKTGGKSLYNQQVLPCSLVKGYLPV